MDELNETADETAPDDAEADGVRTPEKPMAFTWRELWRGAWMAWAVFMAIVTVTILVTLIANPPSGMYASLNFFALIVYFLVAAIVGAVVTTVAAPIARLIGNALQRVRHPAIHVAIFALLGIAVGQVLLAVAAWVFAGTPMVVPLGSLFSVILSAVVGLSSALGWTFTYWRSRHPKARKGNALPPMWG